MENCNARLSCVFGDFEIVKYLEFYNLQVQLSFRDPDPRVKDSGTTLVSHGLKIRLETGCKIREKSEAEERRKKERAPAERRPSFPFVQTRCERENALLRETFNGNSFQR